MKKFLIAGNWKMNKDAMESELLAEEISQGLMEHNNPNVSVLLCPPFTSLSTVYSTIQGMPVSAGAQNCHFEESGAYTGEVSVPMIKHLRARYVIIGHSERREYFNESNQFINKKLKAILEHELKPILCIGETLEERESGKTFDVLKTQLDECLANTDENEIQNIVIAYEPVWAIGTGVSARPEQVSEAHKWIRNYLLGKYGEKANDTLILYGGSMKPENAKELLSIEDVNGGLIGGASLNSESFLGIIQTAVELSS